MSKYITLVGLSRFLYKCKRLFATKSALTDYVPKSGGRFSGPVIFEDRASFEGPLSLDEQPIHGLADPTDLADAANKAYVDGIRPWRRTIRPGNDSGYIAILLSDPGSCVLELSSVGGSAFRGILCISNALNITSAVFVGSGGVDTSEDVQIGLDEEDNNTVCIKFTNSQPVTITCLSGNAPTSAWDIDAPVTYESTPVSKPWFNLESASAGIVCYDKAQALTDAQKEQARENIGAISESPVETTVVSTGATITINSLTPNILHKYAGGALSSLTINALATPSNPMVVNEYMVECELGASSIISLPASLKWFGGSIPTIEAGIWQFSIVDGCIIAGKFNATS